MKAAFLATKREAEECFSPGNTACVAQTQTAPGCGGTKWNFGPGAKLPNIPGLHNRKANMGICVYVFLFRDMSRWISQEDFYFSGTLQNVRPSFICTKMAMSFRCTPSLGTFIAMLNTGSQEHLLLPLPYPPKTIFHVEKGWQGK